VSGNKQGVKPMEQNNRIEELKKIKGLLINYHKQTTHFREAIKEGDLVEKYFKLWLNNEPQKLGLDHKSASDFLIKVNSQNVYVDTKGCKAANHGGNNFLEVFQNTERHPISLAAHYKTPLEEGNDYWLLYFDTSRAGFGQWSIFDVRTLRKNCPIDWNRMRPGGKAARGYIIDNSLAKGTGRWNV